MLSEVQNVQNFTAPDYNFLYDEQVIGTWINGKPLYRKTYTGTTGTTTGSNAYIFQIDLPFEYDVLDYYGRLNFSTGYVFIGWQRGTTNHFDATFDVTSTTKVLRLFYVNTSFNNKPYEVTIEYIKTTD